MRWSLRRSLITHAIFFFFFSFFFLLFFFFLRYHIFHQRLLSRSVKEKNTIYGTLTGRNDTADRMLSAPGVTTFTMRLDTELFLAPFTYFETFLFP